MLASSQSLTVIVPSARSAMICTVMPLAPEIFTRTSLKPTSLRTRLAMDATRAPTPCSDTSRGSSSKAGSAPAGVEACSSVNPGSCPGLSGSGNKKERVPGGPHSQTAII